MLSRPIQDLTKMRLWLDPNFFACLQKHNASGAKEDFDKQIQLEKMKDEVDDKPVEPAQA